MTIYTPTPLLRSPPLSALSGRNIYLKYEVLQPSGSFKDRGIGALCEFYANQSVLRFISSSGGNAGIAVAYASQILQIPATIILPSTTPNIIIDKLDLLKATVIIQGDNWNESDKIAQDMAKIPDVAYIPPFNHPVIWAGYESIITELQATGIKPDAIIVSVGGGGLFSGLVQGLDKIGWQDVALITAETQGAASFAAAMQAHKRVILDHINTVATTLGAKQICERAFALAQTHQVYPQILTDQAVIQACLRFSNDHRILVEPACAAALAVIYEQHEILKKFHNIVVILCGGSGVSVDLLEQWKKKYCPS